MIAPTHSIDKPVMTSPLGLSCPFAAPLSRTSERTPAVPPGPVAELFAAPRRGGDALDLGPGDAELLGDRRRPDPCGIARDLMRAVLEDFPDALDGETIERLETTTNPMGLKIGNQALIRKVADGTQVGGHNRYWTQPFGGRWYVCSQWWRPDHRHNARKLAAWVESLIGDMEDDEARRRLRDVFDGLSAHGE